MSIDRPSISPFQLLPAEIVIHILDFLPPRSLARLGQTCQYLHTHCNNDLLWARLVQENVPTRLESPNPCQSWRELYLAHHPYWFLTRHKIWFADRAVGGNTMTGNVIVARYDHRRGCIEGYRLVAEHGKHTFESWSWNEDVIIHTFNPRVQLWLDDPVIKLDHSGHPNANDVRMERKMQTGSLRALNSALSLCQAIPEHSQHRSMTLWPPSILPAKHRVRRESSSKFYEVGHRPRTLEEASDQTFRLRKWLDFGGMEAQLGFRIGDNIMTFSTLLEESYTPTKDKPWQGLWVGDYSGHGCEFLVVLQKDVDPDVKRISPSTWRSPEGSDEFPDQNFDTATAETQQLSEASSSSGAHGQLHDIGTPTELLEFGEDPSCKGRLEAIKLTGDPNVPKGEYSWIAEDIGPKGLIRVATEQMFKGARVVRSLGHCANRGYRNGIGSILRPPIFVC